MWWLEYVKGQTSQTQLRLQNRLYELFLFLLAKECWFNKCGRIWSENCFAYNLVVEQQPIFRPLPLFSKKKTNKTCMS